MTTPAPVTPTVYYDGGCPVCTREIAHYRARAGAEHFAWVDVARPDADLGPGLARDAALARFHVRTADGELRDGVRGFAELWRGLPRYALLGRIAGLPGVAPVLEAGYRGFLRVRRLWRR